MIGAPINPVFWLILEILSIYSIILLVWVVMSLLITFNVINRYQPVVFKVFDILEKLIQPALCPIRKYVPLVGGLDLSPLVLILAIGFFERVIWSLAH